jgi:tetratricopeptide (TPR) repeat protein
LVGAADPVIRGFQPYTRPGGNLIAAVLDDPRKTWLGCALALMLAAVALSLSRGGMLALLGGAVVVLLLCPVRYIRFRYQGPALVGIALGLALVVWLGFGQFEKRLNTIWTGQALEESRLPLWADAWPLVPEYGLWGTGYGTFGLVEPLHRERLSSSLFIEHAHNEFLEAIIEGGVIRLGITVLAIALVFRAGVAAVRRYANHPEAGLALGALFGITALVIHSIGDFGIHVPAVTLAAAALSAQLVGLANDSVQAETASIKQAEQPTSIRFRFGGAAPVLGALMLVIMALTLCAEGFRMARVSSLRLEAISLADPAELEGRLTLFESAARLSPNQADSQLEAGAAQEAAFQSLSAKLDQGRVPTLVSQLVLAAAPSGPRASTPAMVYPIWSSPAWDYSIAPERLRLIRRHLIPALRHYLTARDLCPLMPRPQLHLAFNAAAFEKAESALVYVGRTKRLLTNDPELWLLAGIVELRAGQKEEACRSLHHCLEISDTYLLAILGQGKSLLTGQDFVDRILPDRPEVLITAALFLFPDDAAVEARQPFLERALLLLKRDSGRQTGESLFLEAQIYHYLGRSDEALATYTRALSMEPRRTAWRLEYARLLYKLGRTMEARRELMRILAEDPGNAAARALQDAIRRNPFNRPLAKEQSANLPE